jgi:dTDP-4-dehydrorhamnose reductase
VEKSLVMVPEFVPLIPNGLNDSVLIVGADGNIGRSLVLAFEAAGKTVWQTTRHHNQVGDQRILLDLSQDMARWQRPSAPISTAILCAAVTSLESCRLDPEYSRLVNVAGTIALSKRLVQAGVFVVFLSTNLVFDGEAPFANITDPVNPRTEYGRQKAEAESQLLALGDQTAIVRFSKVIGPGMPLFNNWIQDLKTGKVIHPFSDMVMAPVSLAFAVKVLREVTERRLPGIFHVSAIQDVSYEEAAQHIARELGVEMKLVQPVSYHESGINFAPLNTSLDSSRLVDLGLCVPQAWDAFHESGVPEYAGEME